MSGLRKRGVGFTSLHEVLDTTTPGGRLVFPHRVHSSVGTAMSCDAILRCITSVLIGTTMARDQRTPSCMSPLSRAICPKWAKLSVISPRSRSSTVWTLPSDQLEFLLQVVWTDFGQLAVDTAVNVACSCDTDHASHDVDALRLVVGEETSLPRAFQAGAERLIGWLTDPRDADFWRARAALPPRQPV